MTRKDYKLLALAFASTKRGTASSYSHSQWERDVNAVAIALQSDNPNFDRVRFIKACGATEE